MPEIPNRRPRHVDGGGKALVNAYHLRAKQTGVRVAYDAMVVDLDIDGQRCRGVVVEDASGRSTITAKAVVVASGGFEANRGWMRQIPGRRGR